jgi:hypothetical protein
MFLAFSGHRSKAFLKQMPQPGLENGSPVRETAGQQVLPNISTTGRVSHDSYLFLRLN